MKTPLLITLSLFSLVASSQITGPIIKAGFGVDADLRANYFNGFIQSGNDDWFGNGTVGTGQPVIDTTGAAAMMNRYMVDPAYRKLPFYRTMRVPQFSTINNRIWIDAIYIRDYNGQAGGDSTAFVSSNKNGDSPGNWNGGSTSVLDKNDIAEMMIHVRRAGPSKTDSLWFMGGLSLQGTTGNRYFDFELYQTDIFYSRSTGKFTNYGPDAGHTSWKFDAAGNITAPGDVIFTAEYSSSSLTAIEARIWIDRASMLITPTAFDWLGGFDGANTGSKFGYANIRPKTTGAYYTGLQSGNNTWAGPFGFIDGGNNLLLNYSARQYMEFSVNLSKLGLDPITLLGGSACGLPFRRILVKTRTSTSFSSELKDFIGPFDFFSAPPVQAVADVPIFCGSIGVSQINVMSPASASVYSWTTPDGHIFSGATGPSITVDQPGTYIVTQQLLDGCSAYAADTVVISFDAHCVPLENNLTAFRGNIRDNTSRLEWTTKANQETEYFEVQRSEDGRNFKTVQTIAATATDGPDADYAWGEALQGSHAPYVFYRLRVKTTVDAFVYSNIIRLTMEPETDELLLFPNPASDAIGLVLQSPVKEDLMLTVYDAAGRMVCRMRTPVKEGSNALSLNLSSWGNGSYILCIDSKGQRRWKKFIVAREQGNF